MIALELLLGELLRVFILIFFLSLTQSLWADQIIFDFIEVQGNTATQSSVILNELGFKVGEALNEVDIQEGISNIRNTNLFTNVNHRVEDQGGKKHFIIKVEERWTIIPIAKLASGGGVSHITIGTYNPNLFGKFFEAGAQYERLGDTNSGVLWFKNPRLFGKKQGFDIQIWNINRLRTKYIQGEEQPEVLTGFLHERQKSYVGYNKELIEKLNFKIFLEHNKDRFSDKLTTNEVKAILAIKGLPPDSIYDFIGFNLDYGRVDINSFRQDGQLVSAEYRYGISDLKEQSDFWQAELNYHYYKTIFKESTLAQRFRGGFTSTKALQYWYYVGGLDGIRGFSDNRFAGRYMALSNTEYRQPFFKSPSLVMQGVGFLDLVAASEEFYDLDVLDGASLGAGLRFILPKVYRFVVRFDFAQPIKSKDTMNFSFGVQQFF